MPELALVTLLVRDCDEAIDWFTRALGFEVVEDTPIGESRWVVVRPPGSTGSGLLLARADGDAQRDRVGDQTGGRVFLFLNTDDFADHARMLAAGVRFLEAPRTETYGTVAVFEDLCGNHWDLIQPSTEPIEPTSP